MFCLNSRLFTIAKSNKYILLANGMEICISLALRVVSAFFIIICCSHIQMCSLEKKTTLKERNSL